MNHIRNDHPKSYNYKFEFTIIALMLSGFSLLTTDLPLHIIVRNFIYFFVSSIDKMEQFFISTFITPLHHMEFSDLVGMLLIIISFILIIRQIRQRLFTIASEAHTCPACHTRLHRIHRYRWQHLLSKVLYLSSGFYHCDTCDYSSLYFYRKSPHLNQGLDG